jgi:hypothetical protein
MNVQLKISTSKKRPSPVRKTVESQSKTGRCLIDSENGAKVSGSLGCLTSAAASPWFEGNGFSTLTGVNCGHKDETVPDDLK